MTAHRLIIGKVYELRFPGIAARVIEPPANSTIPRQYPYLVESLVLRSRWWVNEHGKSENIYSPRVVIPSRDTAAISPHLERVNDIVDHSAQLTHAEK
jgi:hypothetical protein